ncbi:MAG: RNA polymerase sigma factor SigJ [Nannocystales bacterium]
MRAEDAGEFEAHRRTLEGLAYRMCGVLADAQDIVQETHVRWCAADRAVIREPRSWLMTVCSRLAVDAMKSARARREEYVGIWLPEPFVESAEGDPSAKAQLDESVSIALMVAMETLTPAERAAFLLHDVFGYAFGEVSNMLGKSEPTCRKLASRARTRVRRERPRRDADPQQHRRLLGAFFEAAHAGEFERLEMLLSESVELHSDGGGRVPTAPDVLRGPEAVSAFFARIWRQQVPSRRSVQLDEEWFNGTPGILIRQRGRVIAAIGLAVEDGLIDRIFAVRNPEKLTRFES